MYYIVKHSITNTYVIGGTETECDTFIRNNINMYPDLIKVESMRNTYLKQIENRSKNKSLIDLINKSKTQTIN